MNISLHVYKILKDPTTNVFEKKNEKRNQILKDNTYKSFA